jgi:maltoporin
MNMLVPQGFQLQFKNDSATAEIFVSSKHCECFKSDLSDSVLRYGAGATPSSVTLVLSKRSGLKAGDEVFGYVKTTGGTIYRVADPGHPGVFDKWRHEYEGYFRFVMKEMF